MSARGPKVPLRPGSVFSTFTRMNNHEDAPIEDCLQNPHTMAHDYEDTAASLEGTRFCRWCGIPEEQEPSYE